MRSFLAIALSTLLLSGCVTENSYNGSDKPVVQNQINNAGAARTRIALALQYLNTGNNSQAKYNLERASEYAPNLPEVHYSLAYYYQQVGENALADKAYQKALAIKPNDPNTLNNYGTFLCSIDEYDRATDQFLKAIEIPSYIRVAQSYENLALCAIESNDFTNAESYFVQALNHSSQRASTLISLAALYYAKSDLYKASTLLKRYHDTAQVSSRALLLSYLVKQRMGRIEEAEKIAVTILQTYPNSPQARAIRNNQIRQTEFEVLREKYRKMQLNELKGSTSNEMIVEPKIKIIRKKRPSLAKEISDSSNRVNWATQKAATKTSRVTNKKSDVKIISFGEPSVNTAPNYIQNKHMPQGIDNKVETQKTTDITNTVMPKIKVPTHVVKSGENLFSISVRYNVRLRKLLEWNTLKESDRIVKGQKIYINNPNVFYQINAGDSLYDIAIEHQVLIEDLMKWNKLSSDMALKPGSKLLIVDPETYLL